MRLSRLLGLTRQAEFRGNDERLSLGIKLSWWLNDGDLHVEAGLAQSRLILVLIQHVHGRQNARELHLFQHSSMAISKAGFKERNNAPVMLMDNAAGTFDVVLHVQSVVRERGIGESANSAKRRIRISALMSPALKLNIQLGQGRWII